MLRDPQVRRRTGGSGVLRAEPVEQEGAGASRRAAPFLEEPTAEGVAARAFPADARRGVDPERVDPAERTVGALAG
ncbi:hypothetical protein GCM10017786_19750 [Amycolatopsis deserti]|uniref:Uncharacterized protein n=1 Tax=Amycolatopsis deserti TaxID=185696 RepID=A0ABQ3INK1_9PSEU|nr:hypothetical protein GCM10017786_19750 [Amycolatopsis deserti]